MAKDLLLNLLPVFLSFLLGLLVYLVKVVLDLSHRVLALEVKIETLIKELERIRSLIKELEWIRFGKAHTEDKA